MLYYFLTDSPTLSKICEFKYDMSGFRTAWKAYFHFSLPHYPMIIFFALLFLLLNFFFISSLLAFHLFAIFTFNYISYVCYKFSRKELSYYRFVARNSIREEYDYFKWFQIHSEFLNIIPVDMQTSYLCSLAYYDLILFQISINKCLDLFDQVHKIIVDGQIQHECIAYIRTIWNQQQQHRQNITALKKQKDPELAAPELERQLRESFLVAHLRSVVEHVYRTKDSAVMADLQKKLQEEQARVIKQPVDDSWMEEAAAANKPKLSNKQKQRMEKQKEPKEEEIKPQKVYAKSVEKSEKQRRIEEKKKLKKQIEMENRRKEFMLQRQKELEQEKEQRILEEKQKEIELKKKQEIEENRRRELEEQRRKEEELKRQKEMELQRQREIEERRLKLEEERKRQKELELQRQREMEERKQREIERQKELERQMELQRLEEERQKELKRQIESIGTEKTEVVKEPKKRGIRNLLRNPNRMRQTAPLNIIQPEPQLPDIMEPFDLEKNMLMRRQEQLSEMKSNSFEPFQSENMVNTTGVVEQQSEQNQEWQSTLEQLAAPRRRRGNKRI